MNCCKYALLFRDDGYSRGGKIEQKWRRNQTIEVEQCAYFEGRVGRLSFHLSPTSFPSSPSARARTPHQSESLRTEIINYIYSLPPSQNCITLISTPSPFPSQLTILISHYDSSITQKLPCFLKNDINYRLNCGDTQTHKH